jgi:flavin-binding protein dodecin
VLYYASLGFDVLTYKTVRSAARACYDLPNLQPIRERHVGGGEAGDDAVTAADGMGGSWAVSFGMPSRDPSVWRADVTATRRALPRDKRLSVSVVASPEPDWTPGQLADDYAACARQAADAGADCVEANFSCPNVRSSDGQLYQQPELAGAVAARVRQAIPPAVPLAVKIGHVTHERLASDLLAALAPHVQALVMVNCVPARVLNPDGGPPLFGGDRRGIAGRAILDASVAQAALFARLIERQRLPTRLVGRRPPLPRRRLPFGAARDGRDARPVRRHRHPQRPPLAPSSPPHPFTPSPFTPSPFTRSPAARPTLSCPLHRGRLSRRPRLHVRCSTPEGGFAMSVAKVIEIVSNSETSFEDAIEQGLAEASSSVRGISGLEVTNWTADVENNRITRYKVTLHVAFKVEHSGGGGGSSGGASGGKAGGKSGGRR